MSNKKPVKNFFRTVTKEEAVKIIQNSSKKRFIICVIDFDAKTDERLDDIEAERVFKMIDNSKLIKHGLTGGIIQNLDLYFSSQDPDNILPIGKMNSVLLC